MLATLKVTLLVAGTSHIGPMQIVDAELAERNRAISTGFRLPPRHFDLATGQVGHHRTETSLSLATFVTDVDPGPTTTFEKAIRPDPGDQPSIMKQFAAQAIVTYYTEWEEYYRVQLAKALDCDPGDIKSDYFRDLGKMRQDYVHNRGICRNSANNRILKWFSKGQLMVPKPGDYVQLLTAFPADELKVKSAPAIQERQPLKARVKPDVAQSFDHAADRLGITKDEALEQAVKAWLSDRG
jgi:hypothetical protein